MDDETIASLGNKRTALQTGYTVVQAIMVYSSSQEIFDMGSEVWNICMLLWSLLPPYHGSTHG